MTHEVIHGDCLEVMRGMDADSVDAIVTDPPYGLSFMGKRWDYDVPSVEIWAECLRMLKPGGHLLAFAGTRTQHRMAVRIEDAGFEIRDMIAWVYGSGFPKSLNLDGESKGLGTALKPALEPITVARKPLVGTVAANVMQHGTGALNIDGCRIPVDSHDPVNFNTWHSKPNTIYGKYADKIDGVTRSTAPPKGGRWPANLIHDGSDEVLTLFPAGAKPKPPRTGKRGGSPLHGQLGIGTPNLVGHWPADEGGSAARFFYCAKASKRDREDGLDGVAHGKAGVGDELPSGGSNERMNKGAVAPRSNTHPTVKPTDLMRYLCRLVTPPNGVVLDPFAGSGSTGRGAVLEGFRFVGIEREAEYAEIARRRIEKAAHDA